MPSVVQAWPLACLPVGALMETPCLSTLMTALDGPEALLTQKVSPGSFQVLVEVGSQQAKSQREAVQDGPRTRARQPLKVVLDLVFEGKTLDRLLPCLSENLVAEFTSQFHTLHHLQELYMDSVPFLEGHLAQVPERPLEALSITSCILSEADLMNLSLCPNIFELRHLYLSRVPLTSLRPESLRVLLENVAATLKTLDLLDCEITDAQLNALLPALSHCSQLAKLSCLGDDLSMAVLENLLRHTTQLDTLPPELYPSLQRCTAP
ncbi:PRAME family member 12-like [Lepus europaeus]|uniref:PRAME family member 12-like n=1 Tax=Lepus europaeus TaxID=9983 RepID=UPI002B48F01E|nr:PRAME family member 12-like [Lepus europaeus]